MHGLRCDPTLLGWTRLLDEWVVGRTHYNRNASTDIGASRSIRCSGCAFSFPDAHELVRYRYGNSEHPGALLFVWSTLDAAPVST